ncbi:MAG: rod shape-determining protein RodA [Candidatus Parcubacteria bacterium]|jgi:rod shape determining protein RodA
MRISSLWFRFDWVMLLVACALVSVGLVVMYGIGISRPEADLFLFQKQLVGAAIGLVCLGAMAIFDYRQLRGLSFAVYAVGALLLIGVLFFGETVRGTRGWYSIGGLSFQPVEVAKVCFVVSLASYLSRFTHRALPWHVILGSLAGAMGYAALVMLQPDFGSAMVILALWGAVTLFVGIGWRSLLVMVGTGLVVGTLLWTSLLQPYQRDRLLAFIDPSRDPRGAGYNVTQAQIAIGSGGLFGKGIGEGSQARLRFLPEASTDFTFAVVGEELGFTGITFVLGLFGLLFFRLYVGARDAEDDFAVLLAVGIGALFLVHLLINAGMNLGIMPVTGIPFPFLSSASSFLLAMMLSLGIAESIALRKRSVG